MEILQIIDEDGEVTPRGVADSAHVILRLISHYRESHRRPRQARVSDPEASRCIHHPKAMGRRQARRVESRSSTASLDPRKAAGSSPAALKGNPCRGWPSAVALRQR